MKSNKTYPGNKSSLSILPRLINLMPSCKLFVDLFTGSGIIVKTVYAADRDKSMKFIANDVDSKTIQQLDIPGDIVKTNYDYRYLIDGLVLIVESGYVAGNDVFIYADPPYVKSSRRRTKIYRHEFQDHDHISMYRLFKQCPFNIMVSGYDSELYQSLFSTWKTKEFKVSSHIGTVTEKVWMNYDIDLATPVTFDYAGPNFTKRQQIKRKRDRFIKKLMELPKIEREILLKEVTGIIAKNGY